MLTTFLTLGAIVFSTASCSTAPRAVRETDAIAKEILAAEAESELEVEPAARVRQSRHKIPIEINERVREWIYYFTVKDRDRFHRFLTRGQTYRPVIQKVLKKHNVPRELYYLAMIESGFSTHATSQASAVGIWQFIRSTGRLYGLRSDRYIDERRDPIRATEAAAKYLGNLHRMFDSWYLAMAGYNAGEGRIMSAIRRGNSRDFWELADRGLLPRETMNYIPKFLAAVIIGRDPAKFGFYDITPDRVYPETERLIVRAHTRLRDVAQKLKLSHHELEALNPHVRKGVIPAHYGSYALWVPAGKAVAYRRTSKKVVATASHKRSVHYVKRYRVRRGDTLESISERFGTSISALKKINRLKRSRIYSGQSIKVTGDKI